MNREIPVRFCESLGKFLTEHDSMAIGCAQAKLTHSPWLISKRFDEIKPLAGKLIVEIID